MNAIHEFFTTPAKSEFHWFGALQWLYIAAAVALLILWLFAFRKANRKQVRGLIIFTWILLLVNEIFLRQMGPISAKVVNNTPWTYNTAPVEPTTLMLWILPFYFLIPTKRWENMLKPVIGISAMCIGGFVLLFPVFIFEIKYYAYILYYMIQAVLNFALGTYLVLKGQVKIKSGWTYFNYIFGMSSIILVSLILNEIVAAGSHSSVNAIEGWNFMGLQYRVTNGNIYWTDLGTVFNWDLSNVVYEGLFITGYIFLLIFGLLIPYAIVYGLFRPLVRELDRKYCSTQDAQKESASSKIVLSN
ncbi:hypothetical protein [Mycoplasmopsis adleri]|uniref:hypothetical protein n=1 Tax=Mycoplasmopsis adleri TaxID=51362 RepID=UPI0038737422